MKLRIRLFALPVLALLLSGCYTQLQFSQGIHRLTDKQSRYNDNNRDRNLDRERQTEEYAQSDAYESETTPYYYLDYKSASWYDRHMLGYSYWGGVSPYYNGYPYNPYYHDPYYESHFAFSFGIHSFHHPHHFGYWAWYPSFHHHHHYFSWGWFHHPFAFSGFHTTQFVFLSQPVIIERNNRRYSRRNIGRDLVRSSGRSGVRSRSGTTRSRTGLTRRSTGVRNTGRIGDRGNTGRSRIDRRRSDDGRVRSTGRSGKVRKSNRSSGRSGRGNRVDRDRDRDSNRSNIGIMRREAIGIGRNYSRTTRESLLNSKVDYNQQRRSLRDFNWFRSRVRLSFPSLDRMKRFAPSRRSNGTVRTIKRDKRSRSSTGSSVKRRRSGSDKKNNRSSGSKRKRSSGRDRGGN